MNFRSKEKNISPKSNTAMQFHTARNQNDHMGWTQWNIDTTEYPLKQTF